MGQNSLSKISFASDPIKSQNKLAHFPRHYRDQRIDIGSIGSEDPNGELSTKYRFPALEDSILNHAP